jgi:SAM-dependent methyltransferase
MVQHIRTVEVSEDATFENFNEERYLQENPDVLRAKEAGTIKSGLQHFKLHGRREHRKQTAAVDFREAILEIRKEKAERLRDCFKKNLSLRQTEDFVYDFIDEEKKETFAFEQTDKVSSFFYDETPLEIINHLPEGLILDCGAGYRPVYYENVVNFEIGAYPTTDVLGFAEDLPFNDNTFDAVFSFAVLEHVKFPFQAAKEMSRVLKPGGKMAVSGAFLQPLHGYPHHYFNMTSLGLRTLFEEDIAIEKQFINSSTGAIGSLTWLLQHWSHNLPPKVKKKFMKMKVADLLGQADEYVNQPFVTSLPEKTQLELACMTLLTGTKKPPSS